MSPKDDSQCAARLEFNESIKYLFIYGQLPILAVTLFGVLGVSRQFFTRCQDIPLGFWGMIALGILALFFSGAAYSAKSSKEKTRVVMLWASLASTVWYLHYLVALTGGPHSFFQHLYLYVPAVVVIVVHKRKNAELACAGFMLFSFARNYTVDDGVWPAWSAFRACSDVYAVTECLFIGLMLLLLILVNRKIEELAGRVNPCA